MDFPSERFKIVTKRVPDAIRYCDRSVVFGRMLQAVGIRLVCGIVGDVQQVAEAFVCDRLDAPCFNKPGFKFDT